MIEQADNMRTHFKMFDWNNDWILYYCYAYWQIGDWIQLHSVSECVEWATMCDKSKVVLIGGEEKSDSLKQEKNFYKETCQNFQKQQDVSYF